MHRWFTKLNVKSWNAQMSSQTSAPHLISTSFPAITETTYSNISPSFFLAASSNYGGRHQHIPDRPLQKRPGSPPKETKRAGSRTLHINIWMAITTGFSNIKGILVSGEFHPTWTKDTSWASNTSLLVN